MMKNLAGLSDQGTVSLVLGPMLMFWELCGECSQVLQLGGHLVDAQRFKTGLPIAT